MDISVELIAALASFAVFFAVIFIFAVHHLLSSRKTDTASAWMFHDWQDKMFALLFHEDEVTIAKKVGINAERYLHNCHLCQQTPHLKRVIVHRLVGMVLCLVFLVIGLLMAQPVFGLFGLLLAIPLCFFEVSQMDSATKKRRFCIEKELPRFLDLFHTAIIIDLPVEQAIEITAENLRGTILSEELLRTLSDVKLGAMNWQESMEHLAANYEVDSLSDFVLDLSNAYNNGTSIVDSIERQSQGIKQSYLVSMKERASRMTNTILLPIMLFKVMPALLLLGIPMVLQLNSFGLV